MSQFDSMSSQSPGDLPHVRFRRLLFRSWHRGTQEGDLILGSFAENCLPSCDTAQIDRFEALLDCTDPELFDWIIGGITPPPQHDHDVMRLLRDFCTRPSRTPTHNGNRPKGAII
jgi:antitoxin CptB